MISSVEEVVKAKEVLEEAKAELREEGQPFDEHVKVGNYGGNSIGRGSR